jgi:hypothetical protein
MMPDMVGFTTATGRPLEVFEPLQAPLPCGDSAHTDGYWYKGSYVDGTSVICGLCGTRVKDAKAHRQTTRYRNWWDKLRQRNPIIEQQWPDWMLRPPGVFRLS